jgi:pimeloyl-ACP methyl ester carboxylesterase
LLLIVMLRLSPCISTARSVREAPMSGMHQIEHLHSAVRVPAGDVLLRGDLGIPGDARGLVLFAHGSGGSRLSPCSQALASVLEARQFATLLIDLLTPAEEQLDHQTMEYRFDIDRLAQRLAEIADWLGADRRTAGLPIGLLGASTGGGAALMAAALRPDAIGAVVLRGGRPDLAGMAMQFVSAPTLLIVGELDTDGIALNKRAVAAMPGLARLAIVPAATQLFKEPGALDKVAALASDWFATHLIGAGSSVSNRPRASAGRE